ncbi:MAG: HAD family hydrolase [Lachnospiraceae bacterium]|nr:HAD family hydrolase [Lachnospiraceae bacterium]
MRRAVFFDRDGTINKDVGYLHRVQDLQIIDGIPQLIKQCNDKGYLVIVITNQSGIARGIYTVSEMNYLHHVLCERLQTETGAHIDSFYYCPHLPEISGKCNCRKPEPGLFLKAIEEWSICAECSISIGDSLRDEIASKRAGIGQFFYIDEVLSDADFGNKVLCTL